MSGEYILSVNRLMPSTLVDLSFFDLVDCSSCCIGTYTPNFFTSARILIISSLILHLFSCSMVIRSNIPYTLIGKFLAGILGVSR